MKMFNCAKKKKKNNYVFLGATILTFLKSLDPDMDTKFNSVTDLYPFSALFAIKFANSIVLKKFNFREIRSRYYLTLGRTEKTPLYSFFP
jgi:hypothetical protein